MKILAIETSCDDTGIAIIEISDKKQETNFKVLSNIVSSQTIHQQYGGVFPMMAKREHQANLVPVLKEALQKAKLLKIQKGTSSAPATKIKNQNDNAKLKILEKILKKESDLYKNLTKFLEKYKKPFDHDQGKPVIDAIAVTHGPGLEPCLWVGVNFAKALSYFWKIPVIPVNHIEAHILVNWLKPINENSKPKIKNPKQIQNPKSKIQNLFPAVALVVSGGHTQLILKKKIGKYKISGETRDDAAGECFDKAAKILGLGYPGGPIISEIAFKANNPPQPIKLPRPMINSKDYDFSFSGLKTAILYAAKDNVLTEKYIEEMCTEIQQAILDVLIKKTIKAAKDFKVKTIILGGGVSANNELRKQFVEKTKKELSPNSHGRENNGIKVIFPEKHLSTDNALMIAVTGYFNRTKKIA